MPITRPESLAIPGIDEPFSLELPPAVRALRDRARELHPAPLPPLPELELSDARSWAAHTEDEDWLLWRSRWCAERLRGMPIDLEPGELIVGKPLFREPSAEEADRLAAAWATSASPAPPFPGGDVGHLTPDYDKLFSVGVAGILKELAARRRAAGISPAQRTFYEACRMAMQGMSGYIRRVAGACDRMAASDGEGAGQWRELADICGRVAGEPPETFHEALQLMFLTQVAFTFGEGHYLTTPGRMDRTLRPFYEGDLAAGRLTPRRAFELICCAYIQLNRITGPAMAMSVLVGGRDAEGRDVAGELTCLCLAARLATRLAYPTVGLAWHEGTPDELMDFAMDVLATGVGDPAFFNDQVIVQGLREHGVCRADSYDYMNSTCVEIKVAGASNIWVAMPYFNCGQALLDAISDAGPGASGPRTFDGLTERIRAGLAAQISRAAGELDEVWHRRRDLGCSPLASCLTKDCLERGLDMDRGGARYNWVENSFVGLANLVDGLIAVRHLVYDRKELSLPELRRILEADFVGHEPLRRRVLKRLPKYGNDDPEADALAKQWAEFLMESTESNTVGPHRYVPGFFSWVQHERLGSETGATPDGRLAGQPLAAGASAAHGRETAGPTASVLSTTKWAHARALGGVVHNAKFSPTLFETQGGRAAVRRVIETYLRRGGFQMQVNVTSREDLLAAKRHPEQYADLLVRVAGYSDYFVHLNEKLQDEIIARTEHSA